MIDCPDPDTSEIDTPGSNLDRVHKLLPHCDVLIYASTQQKYRSSRVVQELGQAASGCRIVFVQTHADLDEDIRDDWRKQLAPHYEVPDVFFVDSVRALQEQQAGRRPSGDFSRLIDLVTTQLAAGERVQIRRANFIDLVDATLHSCRDQLDERMPAIKELESILAEQRKKLIGAMSKQLADELQTSRNLWERRLLGAITQVWGFSPFSSVLRLYHGLGNLIASTTMYRARSSAQLALIGALQGGRWLSTRRKEKEAEHQLERLGSFGIDDAILRESQLVVGGYVREAQLSPELAERQSLDSLRHEAVRVEDRFLGDAGRRIDDIIDAVAKRHSGPITRWIYEILFFSYLAFVLYRIGRNFFIDSFWYHQPLLTVDFYISAAVFLVLWSGFLVMTFTYRLRGGLRVEIDALAQDLALNRISEGLFPELETACRDIHAQRDRLEAIAATTTSLRSQIAITPSLGSISAGSVPISSH